MRIDETEKVCIMCPIGCSLTITSKDTEVTVEGHQCKRGEVYGTQEVTNPMRTVTTSVSIRGGEMPRISLRTAAEVPKSLMFEVVKAMKSIHLKAPIHVGEVVLENVAKTSVMVVATTTVATSVSREASRENGC